MVEVVSSQVVLSDTVQSTDYRVQGTEYIKQGTWYRVKADYYFFKLIKSIFIELAHWADSI